MQAAERKISRQTPTLSFVKPYENTDGSYAIELYNGSGRTALPWQELLIYDILAFEDDGLWTHTKYGYSVPRRNGKNEVITIREMYGLVERGERILHTAHRTTTTHAAWERLLDLLEKAKIPILSSYRAFGKEHIEIEGGGKIEFRTRTSKGGLGEGFDVLIIDEAQEYQDDQESALKYVVSDSPNPQTIFCGTPPTATSSGTVFTKLRADILSGNTQNAAWAEWGVTNETDPKNRDAWYETNPSLGFHLTERKIADEIGGDTADFNIQRLGLWMLHNLKSAISRGEWEALKLTSAPKLRGKISIGIRFAHDGENVSVVIAAKTTDGKVLVDALDCRPVRAGTEWIINFLIKTKSVINQVVVDGANGQALLATAMKDAGLREPVMPMVKQVIEANAAFEQALYHAGICHMGQPALVQAATNCERRAIGTSGGFGWRSLKDGVDVSLVEATALAYWLCITEKPKKKQEIFY